MKNLTQLVLCFRNERLLINKEIRCVSLSPTEVITNMSYLKSFQTSEKVQNS